MSVVCARCNDTGRVYAFVPLFPQIDSKACPACRADHKLCIGCGTSSPGDDCAVCDKRRAEAAAAKDDR